MSLKRFFIRFWWQRILWTNNEPLTLSKDNKAWVHILSRFSQHFLSTSTRRLGRREKKFCSRLFLVCVWLGKEHAQNCVSNVVFAACLKFSHHKFCGKLRGSCRSGTRFDSRFPWAISLWALSPLWTFPFTFTSKRFIIKRSEFRIDWESQEKKSFLQSSNMKVKESSSSKRIFLLKKELLWRFF